MENLTRQLKALYEEIVNRATAGKRGLDEFLFSSTDDDSSSAAFALDELIVSPHAVAFRKAGENSQVIPYVAGVGNVYEVPRSSAKTPITEQLRDAVIAGGEAFEAIPARERRLFGQIATQHTVGHNVTRWKLALDVIRTGKFSPLGLGGEDIGLEIDFGRSAGLDVTYDFTAVGATMDKALGALYDAYRAENGSGDELVVLMGDDWLKQFETDSNVIKRLEANTSNILLQSNMLPPELMNTYGLRLIGRYRIPGKVDPIWIVSYKPQGKFIAYKGATAAEFMPTDEAVMFALGSTRYKVRRGVDVFNDSGAVIRAIGDVVFDSYMETDAPARVLRSSTRYAFVPGNVNHTARSTGEFAES
jgi:hypothetical protein